MTLSLRPHEDGTLLNVRAQPGANRHEIRGIYDGSLRIAVTASPEKGKANQAIIQLLAKKVKVAKSRIVLTAGASARNKTFLVVGCSEKHVADLLTEYVT